MKKLTACLLIWLAWCTIAHAAKPTEFRFQSPIISSKEAITPVAVRLTADVIARTTDDFSDLRLFDDRGAEVPYVIHALSWPEQRPPRFTWEVSGYTQGNATQAFILKRPKGYTSFVDLEFNIPAVDFYKDIEVYAGDQKKTWTPLAHGTLFDFSSRIDLRCTLLKFPTSAAAFLKVIMRDHIPTVSMTAEDVHLRYKDLDFNLNTAGRHDIRINQFSSNVYAPRPERNTYDQVCIVRPSAKLDKDGNSLISFGHLNLPVDKIDLEIGNAFFYRDVQSWVADKDEEQAYHQMAQDVAFRIPGVAEVKTGLQFGQPQYPYVRLKVINRNNPPLEIKGARIEWIARDLFFIPESRRSYALYYGNKEAMPPQYEVARLVPKDYATLIKYPRWQLGAMHTNASYNDRVGLSLRALLEKYLLNALVILVVCVLGFWVISLMKKLPMKS